jgi:hypothetical protein
MKKNPHMEHDDTGFARSRWFHHHQAAESEMKLGPQSGNSRVREGESAMIAMPYDYLLLAWFILEECWASHDSVRVAS